MSVRPPFPIVHFHKRDKIINGSQAEPNSAHALPNRLSILSIEVSDKNHTIRATNNTDIRLINSVFFAVA